MTDTELTQQLELIAAEMNNLRREYDAIIKQYLDAERIAAVAIASNNINLLKNKDVISALINIPKPNVSEKQFLLETELGEIAFKKAVIDSQIKILEKYAGTLQALAIHSASLRKAEKY